MLEMNGFFLSVFYFIILFYFIFIFILFLFYFYIFSGFGDVELKYFLMSSFSIFLLFSAPGWCLSWWWSAG